MAHLVVSEPGRIAAPVPLDDELVIGRHEECGLCLMDGGVSRKHARVQRDADGHVLADLGSRHGTLVNGARLDAPTRLRDGDVVQIGRARLVYRAGITAPAQVRHTATIDPGAQPMTADEERLHAFYDVSRALDAFRDPDELLGRLLDAIVDALRAERGVIGVGTGHERPRQLARARAGEVIVADDVVRRMVEGAEGVIVDAAGGGAGMGAPMQAGGRVAGFVYLERSTSFRPDDLTFLIALARVAGAAHAAARDLARASVAIELAGDDDATHEILGASEPVRRLRAQIARYGASDAAVLVRGESGSGKELVARGLHASSGRADQPFVALNCAAIPEALVESELFGHAKGAFSGASRDKRGRFALAHRGTLFLDEIGDLSPAAQAKLLRALQDGEIQPVGADGTSIVDVRVISATHKDLQAEIAAGRFREDLFYRLAVIEIDVPPLRARAGDVALLAQDLLRRAATRLGKRIDGFTPGALDVLSAHPWPGNVRQLANEIERAAILATEPMIDAGLLSERIRQAGAAPPVTPAAAAPASLAERFAALEPAERALVAEALTRAGGNLSEAARLLGITRIMMKRRAERFGLRGADGG